MVMIWGLQISSLTVKQQQQNSAKNFSLFFVVAFMENPLPCKRGWDPSFSSKQFRVSLGPSTKLCPATDILTL